MQLLHGDLCSVKADAIVISANPEPICGAGVDAAIYDAAGADRLLDVRKVIGRISVGKAVCTEAFSLRAKYIIHTVAPMWRGGRNGERELLGNCFYNCLQLAERLGCKSIAFPLIGTQSGRIPKKEAIRIGIAVCEHFPSQNLDINLVLYDEKSVETAKQLYPKMEIMDVEDGIRRTGDHSVNVDPRAIWVPQEHNLYCEQKNIQKYKDLERIIYQKTNQSNRFSAIPGEAIMTDFFVEATGSLTTGLALSAVMMGIGAGIDALASATEKAEDKRRANRSVDEQERAERIKRINNNIALSRLIDRELKIERNPFESSEDHTARVCADYLSEILSESRTAVLKNFRFSLKAGLKKLAIQNLYIMPRSQETELQFYERCLSLLGQLYDYEDDEKFLLIAAYLKRTDLGRKMRKIVRESQNIHFIDAWKQLSPRQGSREQINEAERINSVFYGLLKEYISFKGKSIYLESEQGQSDFYKARNYIFSYREDWLYAMTPPYFWGCNYKTLTDQYSNMFSYMYLKFHTLLEAIGMLDDFQIFCELSKEECGFSVGENLFHIIYNRQCRWYIENRNRNFWG